MFNIYYLLLVFIVPYLFVYNLSGSRSSHCLKIFLCNKVPIHLILVPVEPRGQTVPDYSWTAAPAEGSRSGQEIER